MKQEDLIGLSRQPIVNQLHALVKSFTKKPPHYDMHGLVEENKLQWIWRNLGHLGNSRYAYQTYSKPEINNGIFKMPGDAGRELTIALLSDWASDTVESKSIAELASGQDYAIHLGDTYYVGNSEEIACNFNDKFGGPFPYGNLGSFALMGNHEMYCSGKPYFRELLPYMGLHTETRIQEASFFCLENDSWRIIGLDTGYDSLRGWFGIKADLNLKLPDVHYNWLRDVVKPGNDKRGLIFLSHHQYHSAFESEFLRPGKQLSELFGSDRTVLWFWGHEHRLAVYGRNNLPNGAAYYARCIGHGGMPCELGDKFKPKNPSSKNDAANKNLVIYDEREKGKVDGKISLGFNGYLILKLKDADLTVEYHNDNTGQPNVPRKVMEEKWTLDKATGKLKGVSITDHTIGTEKKLTKFADDIRFAINTETGHV